MGLTPNRRASLGFALILTSVCSVKVFAQKQASLDAAPGTPAAQSKGVNAPDESRQPDPASPNASKETTLAEGSKQAIGILKTNASADDAKSERSASSVTPNPQGAATDKWQFQLTPYLWIVGLSGRAGIGNLSTDVSSGITDSSVHVNFGFMATFEARKDRLLVLTDLQYSDLATDHTTPGPLFSSARASFKTFILDPEAGYRVIDKPDRGASVDVLAGVRFWHLTTDLDFNRGLLSDRKVSAGRGWVDAVAGLRGRILLWPRLFAVGKGDLGGGGSHFTYQLFGGAGFEFGKRYAIIGGYRHLHVNYNNNNLLFDMSLHGPLFGFAIKF